MDLGKLKLGSQREKYWQPIEIALKLKNGYCSQFRVISELVKVRDWLDAIDVPLEIDQPATSQPFKLPLLVGVVEGPRDMPDCSIRSMPEEYSRALLAGKCPIGLKPPVQLQQPVPNNQ